MSSLFLVRSCRRRSPAAVAGIALLAAAALPLSAEPLPVASLERAEPVNYATEVYPFLKANCLACHNSTKAKADLILESPKDMIRGGDSGPAIEPGNGENSFLFTTAAHIEEPTMPPTNNKSKAKNLTPEQLALLKLWIDQGAKGDAVATQAPDSWTVLSGPQPIYASALSGDGRYAAAGRGQRIHLYDLKLNRLVATLHDPSLPAGAAHRDLVHALDFSPEGTLASGGYRVAKIWQRQEASASSVIALPNDPSAVAVSPSGKLAAVGTQDGGILLMELDQPEASPVTIKDHAKAVTALQFSADNALLYSVSEDQTVKRRSIADPTVVVSQDLPAVATSLALVDDDKQVIVAGADHGLRWLNRDLESPPGEAKPHPQPVIGLAATGTHRREVIAGYADGTVVHLKLDPAKPEAAPTEVRRFAHGAAIDQVAVSSTDRLATAGPTGSIKLWNLTDGKLVAELKGDPTIPGKIESLNGEVTVANRLKAHWDKKAPEAEKLWQAESEKAKEAGDTIAKARRERIAKQQELDALVARISPAPTDEEKQKAEEAVVTAERALAGAIRNRDLSTRLAGDAFARQIEAQSASKEAETLAAALKAEVEAVQKLVAEAEKATHSLEIGFSADGLTLAQAMKDGTVRLWSAETGTWLEDFAGSTGLQQMAFAGSTHLLTTQEGRNLLVWNLPGSDWSLAHQLGDGVEAAPFADRVTALAFHPEGNLLVTGSGVPSRGGDILTWNTADWTEVGRLDEAHRDTLTAFTFSPDGDRLASASTDRLIKVFDTDTLDYQQTFEGHTSHVLDVDWNADGLTLASAGADLQVKLWDVTEGQQKSKVEGYLKEIGTVRFLGATETLLTASGDKTLKLANAPLPDAGDTFLHTAAASDDGSVIIAGGQDGVLRLWDAKAKKLLQSFPSPEAEAAKVASE